MQHVRGGREQSTAAAYVCFMGLYDTGLRIFVRFIIWSFVLCVETLLGICIDMYGNFARAEVVMITKTRPGL